MLMGISLINHPAIEVPPFIAMENGPFMEVYLLKMVIFHGYFDIY
jgi:hypothetical protein